MWSSLAAFISSSKVVLYTPIASLSSLYFLEFVSVNNCRGEYLQKFIKTTQVVLNL